MWFATRISNAYFHRPLFLLSSPVSFKPTANAVSLSKKDSLGLVEDCGEFLPWLQQKAGLEISSVLSVGVSIYGRSLFASKFIEAGDCILKVPYSVQISPDNILPKIGSFLGDDVSNIARLAVVFLAEQKMRQDSEWAPYISSLPQIGELHSTIFWSKAELEMVQKSPLYQDTINHRAYIEKEFLKVRPVLERFPHNFEDMTVEDFMHAYALVGSRAWGTSKGLSLIPFADFLNHDGVSEAVLLSDEDREISEVIADRDYAAGEEVFIRYGKFSNATLLLDFGFTLPYNIYDQVQIWMGISQHDPLCKLKLELLQKHCMPTITYANGFNSFGNSFTIKEVRSSRGKGRGIPQSLRAFVRVLSATSPQELKDMANEAAQTDGRLARRPLNSSREIEAHDMLLSQIAQMIQEYDASIKSLGYVNSHATCSQVALRRRMAKDLLAGELRILQSASSWLKNYCATLSIANNYPRQP
ncbi:ribulose-1,5 bisphosphate carboxylase/oxygenase large subunit N-methyltransferase, chloroplastic-like [Tasmannia lanceolata]|uniref:ribulose-1,5 bisphosphate carboxylase/oxygenase large subunit N-methyltransferase, chloroplastic-like n=1 Tax=Tasmannia lanceolata TaxID=3420 RepID=UPI00406430CF